MNWLWTNYWRKINRLLAPCEALGGHVYSVFQLSPATWIELGTDSKTDLIRMLEIRYLERYIQMKVSLTYVEQKWVKFGSTKISFLSPVTVEMQLVEMQTLPFLGSISKFINYFLAAVSLADLHVLGPKWVETEFQDEVPRRRALRALLCISMLKTLTTI